MPGPSTISSTKPARDVYIIIGCLNGPLFSSSVRFFASAANDVYLIARIPLFYEYLESILEAHVNDSVYVALLHKDTNVMLEVLSLLRRNYLDKFPDQNSVKLSTTSSTRSDTVPLGYKLAIVQMCDGLGPLDHLAEQNVVLQQILRFVAVSHNGVYAAVSDLGLIASDGSRLALFVAEIVSGLQQEELQIYDATGSKWDGNFKVHQLTLAGWDSWRRIEVAAKAIPRTPGSVLLDSPEAFTALNEAYVGYFKDLDSDLKRKLLNLLDTFTGEKVVEPVSKPQPPLTYAETVEKLQSQLGRIG